VLAATLAHAAAANAKTGISGAAAAAVSSAARSAPQEMSPRGFRSPAGDHTLSWRAAVAAALAGASLIESFGSLIGRLKEGPLRAAPGVDVSAEERQQKYHFLSINPFCSFSLFLFFYFFLS